MVTMSRVAASVMRRPCTICGTSAERPFRLVAAPARNFLNTSFTETPTSRAREGRPTVMLHPDDATRLGVGEGDLGVEGGVDAAGSGESNPTRMR